MQLVGGLPLVGRSIANALQSDCFDTVAVASDDEEILKFAESMGATPVAVAQHMAGDESPVHPVLLQALNQLAPASPASPEVACPTAGMPPRSFVGDEREKGDLVCYLRATSPLTRPRHIRAAVDLMLQAPPTTDSVVSVKPVTGAHPSRFKAICATSGLLRDAFPAMPEPALPVQSKGLVAYVRNGAVVVARPHVWRAGRIWGQHSMPLVMSDEESLDINTPLDLAFARFLEDQYKDDIEARAEG